MNHEFGMEPKFHLGKHLISPSSKMPFIIAEVGVNHEGSLDKAKKLIDDAVEGGAHSVKFQAYKAETISIRNSPAYWDQKMEPCATQFELFKKFDSFGQKEFEALAKHCESVGTLFSCTPFDFASADFLNDLMPFFKISSSDITNVPFLRHIAKKEKPIILSTGAATVGEIEVALQTMKAVSNAPIALLHCVLNYPCPPAGAHLNTIRYLKNLFPQHVIGYSDHVIADPAMLTLTYAYLAGAVILEKHFTDDKKIKGNDHLHSMNKQDVQTLRSNIEFHHQLGGHYQKDYLSDESRARKHARRSIVVTRDLDAGHRITLDDVTFLRPAHGISPSLVDHVIGAELSMAISQNSPLQFEHLKSLERVSDT